MKTVSKLLVLLSMFYALNVYAGESEVGLTLGGAHLLNSIIVSPAGSNTLTTTTTLTWQLDSNHYGVITIPLSKIQLEFNEGLTVPAIRFRWIAGSLRARALQQLVDEQVEYVLLVGPASLWTTIVTAHSYTTMVFKVEAEAR